MASPSWTRHEGFTLRPRQVIIAPELKQFRAFKRPLVNWRRCSKSAWAWNASEHRVRFFLRQRPPGDSGRLQFAGHFVEGFTCFYHIRLLGVATIHIDVVKPPRSDRVWWKDVSRHLGVPLPQPLYSPRIIVSLFILLAGLEMKPS